MTKFELKCPWLYAATIVLDIIARRGLLISAPMLLTLLKCYIMYKDHTVNLRRTDTGATLSVRDDRMYLTAYHFDENGVERLYPADDFNTWYAQDGHIVVDQQI